MKDSLFNVINVLKRKTGLKENYRLCVKKDQWEFCFASLTYELTLEILVELRENTCGRSALLPRDEVDDENDNEDDDENND